MTAPAIDHVLLTRFNLPSGGSEARIRASETWLANRWSLFERYCAPSVAAQTTSPEWIIYFDPESPEWLRAAIAPYVESGLFTPMYRAEVSREELLLDVCTVASGHGRMLVTTNLDNDDGLAADFAERVQRAVDFADRRAVFLVNGIIKSNAGVYRRRDPDNAFCSVAEPWDDPVMCWSDWHLMLRRNMPVVEVGGSPGWLQVVHGENVSNRVRGTLTTPQPWRDLFPGALEDVTPPRRTALLRDRLISAPARTFRDEGRSAARRVAIAILGKDGMQRAKARLGR
ncbi:hypothetical protein GCM10025760_00170 [Microbacterium yannicii]|uniref:Rhamnosyltransferase n=1 Tax=Microbacterium yannicii TaxID=671622 RepID=A0ABP9LW45_9MICO|nr:glycosyltransferase [Microbacterium yannicii]MCO5952329.1 putative rhamnosyl transferase [Microbacterium yannicii]